MFQKAIECELSQDCQTFDDFRRDVHKLENQADKIKRRVRGHLPKGTLLPVDKFQLFRYLREQDQVLDSVEDSLDWISYRPQPGIPEQLHQEFTLLVDSVIDPIEELSRMVTEARKYFQSYSEKQRRVVKEIIRALHKQEREADRLEDLLKRRTFNTDLEPVTVFHMIRLAEIIGSIADHAENAGDMMRAMIAR